MYSWKYSISLHITTFTGSMVTMFVKVSFTFIIKQQERVFNFWVKKKKTQLSLEQDWKEIQIGRKNSEQLIGPQPEVYVNATATTTAAINNRE